MNCTICEDTGYRITDKGVVRCKCVVEKKLKEYVGSFVQYKYNPKYARPDFLEDYLITDLSQNSFGSLVKSVLSMLYLVNNDATWKDITGQDLVTVTFGGDEEYLIKDLQDIDFLIIKLGRDGNNRSLGMWLLNLLTRRKELDNPTWIYLYPNFMPNKMTEVYGQEVWNFIKDKENYRKLGVKG